MFVNLGLSSRNLADVHLDGALKNKTLSRNVSKAFSSICLTNKTSKSCMVELINFLIQNYSKLAVLDKVF